MDTYQEVHQTGGGIRTRVGLSEVLSGQCNVPCDVLKYTFRGALANAGLHNRSVTALSCDMPDS